MIWIPVGLFSEAIPTMVLKTVAKIGKKMAFLVFR
jgi:hypothetical protein